MVEYILEFKEENLRDVFETMKCEVKPLTKKARNLYFLNLSNCCKEPLRQKKFCSKCNSEIVNDKELKLKGIEIDKVLKPFSKEQYEKIIDSFDNKRITIEKVVDIKVLQEEENELYNSENLWEINKDKKENKRELYELYAVLKESNSVLYGKTNVRETPYQVVIVPNKKGLIMRGLLENSQIYDMKELETELLNSKILEEKIDLIKMLKNDKLELDKFINERNEQIGELIKKTLNGEVSLDNSIENDVIVVKEVADTEKLDKLKALKEKLAKKKKVMVEV